MSKTIAEIFMGDWKLDSQIVSDAIERLESRLATLETWKSDHFEDDALEHPKDGRDWIPVETEYWVLFEGNAVAKFELKNLWWSNVIAIMSYYEGDTAPEAPESEA